MEFKFKPHKQYSRDDVAKAFNKTIYNIDTQSRKYKANGGRKGLLNSNQQVPLIVFVSRIIRIIIKAITETALTIIGIAASTVAGALLER